MTNYRRSALVVWTNGRREWLPLVDADLRSQFELAMRQGCFREVVGFSDDVRSGVLPRKSVASSST